MKKVFRLTQNIKWVLFFVAVTFYVSSNTYATIRSDVNNDLQKNTTDAMLTLKNSLGLNMANTGWYETLITGDVNCDNVTNSTDAQLILRYSLGFDMESTDWCDDTRAFLGAEGGGAQSVGGRGGIVYEVTNLDDDGEGSLRYGLSAAEYKNVPRTIIFKVGGYIHLDHVLLVMDDSFITVAGQTAPGDGITIVSPSNPDSGVLEFRNAHNIIMRYISIRKGGAPPEEYRQQGSNFSIIGDSHDIILDHCSIGWAGDENFGMWNVHPDGMIAPRDISFQWSISSENLRRPTTVDGSYTDSTGFFLGSGNAPETTTDISVHHNLFARNNNRNPLMKGASGEVASNIIYNWRWWATGIGGGMELDVMDNVYKAGPARDGGDKRPEISYKPAEEGIGGTGIFGDPSIFLEGNIGYHNADPAADAWDTMMHETDENWAYQDNVVVPVSRDFQRMEQRELTFPITRENALALDNVLLDDGGVGNSRKLLADGSWSDNRDLIDTRVIEDYENGVGDALVSSVDMVGGWPYYNVDHYEYIAEAEFIAHPELYQLDAGTPYTDGDHDGMSDLWEDNNGLNKYDSTDGILDNDNDGYTNLEEFLSGDGSPITYPAETTFTYIPTDDTVALPEYKEFIIDPEFDTKVTRISDRPDNAVNHNYPKTQTWNADMTKMRLNNDVVNAETLDFIGYIDGRIHEIKWSSINSDTLYGMRHYYNDDEANGIEDDFNFVKTTVTNGNMPYETVKSFSKDVYKQVHIGPWEGNIDFNDKYVVFSAQKIGETYLTAILYDIETGDTAIHDFTEIHWWGTGDDHELDWISISPLGNYILINWDQDPDAPYSTLVGAIDQYDLNFNFVRRLSERAGHGDIGVNAQGQEVYVQFEYGSRNGIWMYNLEDGIETQILPDKYNGGHVSCRNYRRRGWCYLATKSEGWRDVFALKLDDSGLVNRFAQTLATNGNAQGGVSPDGTKIIFQSDWNGETGGEYESFISEIR